MKNILTSLPKSVFIPLGLTATSSATDAAVQKKTYRPGTTALIISNEELQDTMKIFKSIGESGLLIKGISETVKNEVKEQKGWFLGMLLSTSAASLLESAITGQGVTGAGEAVIRD